jgi:L-iditol 2-dehydrogenase
MKAAILRDHDDINVEEVPDPKTNADEVLVKVMANAVCPSDLGMIKNASSHFIGRPGISGHEFAGVVVGLGKDVTNLKMGERVVSDLIFRDYTCYYCTRGYTNLCVSRYKEDREFGYAQYIRAPADRTYSFPDSVSFEEASLTEPLAASINGISRANIRSRDDVVIIGSGPIGLLQLQLSKMKGARVIMCDLIEKRLELAKQLGADAVINVKETDLVEEVKKLTDEKGANSVIVAVGDEHAEEQSILITRPTGTVVFFAGTHKKPPRNLQINPDLIHYGELTITGASDKTHEQFKEALKLIVLGSVKIKPLISHKFTLDDITKAIDVARGKEGIKIVVEPNS